MQLTYRGNHYELTNSGIPTIPGEVIGRYRGAVLRASRCTTAVPADHSLNLVYRGAHYRAVANPIEPTGLVIPI